MSNFSRNNPLKIFWDIRDIEDLEITSLHQNILFVIASCISNNNPSCWHSLNILAKKTHTSRSSLIRALKFLDKKGYIKKTFSEGRGNTNHYAINYQKLSTGTQKNGVKLTPFATETVSGWNLNGVMVTPKDINEDIKASYAADKKTSRLKNNQSLPIDFKISDENKILLERRRINPEKIHNKFVAFYYARPKIKKTKELWHQAEKKWIVDENIEIISSHSKFTKLIHRNKKDQSNTGTTI